MWDRVLAWACIAVGSSMLFAASCSSVNIDVNGYHAHSVRDGKIDCEGACP